MYFGAKQEMSKKKRGKPPPHGTSCVRCVALNLVDDNVSERYDTSLFQSLRVKCVLTLVCSLLLPFTLQQMRWHMPHGCPMNMTS